MFYGYVTWIGDTNKCYLLPVFVQISMIFKWSENKLLETLPEKHNSIIMILIEIETSLRATLFIGICFGENSSADVNIYIFSSIPETHTYSQDINWAHG